VYKLVSEDRERKSKTINPPPSTVSIVLASRLGVNASKSYKEKQRQNQLTYVAG